MTTYRVRVLLVSLLAVVLGLLPGAAVASAAPSAPAPAVVVTQAPTQAPTAAPTAVTRTVALSSLPPEATDTYNLIRRGGPYPYSQDGIVFQNREGVLPAKPSGYYHEYTVKTPGSSDRGARRIVTGSNGEYYYTGDHYETFVAVDVNR